MGEHIQYGAGSDGKVSITGGRTSATDPARRASIDLIADKHRGKPGALLAVLEECQRGDAHRHLSEETLYLIAQAMGEPLSRVYSVATFYSYYNLIPQGEHVIVVCRGTACHTRGSLGLLRETLAELGAQNFHEDEEAAFTTDDKRFTVRTVACFGQCALAPVVAIDGAIHSRVTISSLKAAIAACGKGARR